MQSRTGIGTYCSEIVNPLWAPLKKSFFSKLFYCHFVQALNQFKRKLTTPFWYQKKAELFYFQKTKSNKNSKFKSWTTKAKVDTQLSGYFFGIFWSREA